MVETTLVGIAQWLARPGEADENLEAAVAFVEELGKAGCDLVVLPELWPCGYDRASLREDVRACAEPLDGPRTRALADAAARAGVWLAAGSVPERADGEYFNTAPLFACDGTLRAWHRKAHLYSPSGEDSAYSAGDRLTVCDTEPFGPVGLAVCFDGDFPEVARTLRLGGARVVILPSAYELEAETWWDRLYPANAMTNGQWWIMANQCGSHSSCCLLGGSKIISPFGEVVAKAGQAVPGMTPAPELLVAELRLHEELESADRELGVLVSERNAPLYSLLDQEDLREVARSVGRE
jgi:predicted amidohydrolase